MMKKAITTSLMLLLTLCAAAQFGPMTDADTQYAGTLPKAGAMAPEVKLKTIDGKSFKLSKLRGHYVVLDFWASWCRDCRKDAPVMVDMWKRFGPRGVEFVGVSFDTDKAAWRKALEQYGIGYTQVSELKAWKETAEDGKNPSPLDPHYALIRQQQRDILAMRTALGLTPMSLRRIRGQGVESNHPAEAGREPATVLELVRRKAAQG